jgi:hypothetical protein
MLEDAQTRIKTPLLISPSVRQTASEDGAVLLDIEQGICFSLNPVGLRIWELLKARYNVDQIADTLTAEFPVPRSQLVVDIREFLQALENKHLVYPSVKTDRAKPLQSWTLPWRKQRPSGH